MRAQRERMTDALERKNADVDDAARDDLTASGSGPSASGYGPDGGHQRRAVSEARPPPHPKFVNADKAAANLTALQCFKDAECVKVNPDTLQKAVCRAVLEAGKTS